MSGINFSKLTNQLIKSDQKAFDQIFRLLYSSLVKFSYKYLKDKSAAVDVVQEAFMKVWQNRKDLTRNQSIKTYLFRTVRNLSLNYLRDTSRMTYGLETDSLIAEGNLSHQDSQHEQLNLVKQWIETLPDRQKEILKLSRFEELSHEEIAMVLEISKRTVNNHIVSAMKKLKKYHDEYTQMKL